MKSFLRWTNLSTLVGHLAARTGFRFLRQAHMGAVNDRHAARPRPSVRPVLERCEERPLLSAMSMGGMMMSSGMMGMASSMMGTSASQTTHSTGVSMSSRFGGPSMAGASSSQGRLITMQASVAVPSPGSHPAVSTNVNRISSVVPSGPHPTAAHPSMISIPMMGRSMPSHPVVAHTPAHSSVMHMGR